MELLEAFSKCLYMDYNDCMCCRSIHLEGYKDDEDVFRAQRTNTNETTVEEVNKWFNAVREELKKYESEFNFNYIYIKIEYFDGHKRIYTYNNMYGNETTISNCPAQKYR